MRKSKWFSSLYVWLVMVFLYAPIAVLIIFSFNDSKSRNTLSQEQKKLLQSAKPNNCICQPLPIYHVRLLFSPNGQHASPLPKYGNHHPHQSQYPDIVYSKELTFPFSRPYLNEAA